MKRYSIEDQRLMATWAADCADRVLGLFEKAFPKDDRPRKAIEAGRDWVRTGVFSMSLIRGASLAAHAAAREANDDPARFAARAAGQAVATAHVPQHAFGAAYYALKAVAATDPANAEAMVAKERDWQLRQLAPHLREEASKRVVIGRGKHGVQITIRKGEGF